MSKTNKLDEDLETLLDKAWKKGLWKDKPETQIRYYELHAQLLLIQELRNTGRTEKR